MFDFVQLDLIRSVLSQEIGWEESLRSDLFCVWWVVKLWLVRLGKCR